MFSSVLVEALAISQLVVITVREKVRTFHCSVFRQHLEAKLSALNKWSAFKSKATDFEINFYW
jgi:hypothetical protein